MKNKGFTLIELLVVIAIIGILSAIVLSSLDTARNKGADAAIKSDLDNARAQAENYYDTGTAGINTYSGVCVANSGATNPGILGMMVAAQQVSGAGTLNTTLTTAGSSGLVTCHDGSGGWAAESPLKTSSSTFWCVDSTGTSSSHTTGHIAASGVVCVAG